MPLPTPIWTWTGTMCPSRNMLPIDRQVHNPFSKDSAAPIQWVADQRRLTPGYAPSPKVVG